MTSSGDARYASSTSRKRATWASVSAPRFTVRPACRISAAATALMAPVDMPATTSGGSARLTSSACSVPSCIAASNRPPLKARTRTGCPGLPMSSCMLTETLRSYFVSCRGAVRETSMATLPVAAERQFGTDLCTAPARS